VASAIEQSLPFLNTPIVKQAIVYPMWGAAKWIDKRYFLRRPDFSTHGDTAGWLIRARSPRTGTARSPGA
jgi:hypothetical protein